MKLVNFIIKYPLSVFLLSFISFGVGLSIKILTQKYLGDYSFTAGLAIELIAFLTSVYVFNFLCVMSMYIYRADKITDFIKKLLIFNISFGVAVLTLAYFNANEHYQKADVLGAFCLPSFYVVSYIKQTKNGLHER